MTDLSNFLDLVKSRVSCRDYRPMPVPDEVLNACIEAARLAPSACNRQPWRLVVVRDPDRRRRLAAEALLPGIPMPWVGGAPVIVALCAEQELLTHRIAPWFSKVRYDLLDPGIAGEHLVLAATAAGLGSCWIGWINPKAVANILALPRKIKPLALITLGYPASNREPSPRRALDEIRRHETWDDAGADETEKQPE